MDKLSLSECIPPVIRPVLRFLHPSPYGWFGRYASWAEALADSTGYAGGNILEKTLRATLQVMNGEAQCERDSVVFDHIQYCYPVLASLLWICCLNGGRLHLIDFGGSLGSSYFQNRRYLRGLADVRWHIVEQPAVVDCGKKHIENDELKFFHSIDEVMRQTVSNAMLLSGVIQYLDDPQAIMKKIIGTQSIQYLIFDMVPLLLKGETRITVQKVNPKVYRASYPARFFKRSDFLGLFDDYFEVVNEFTPHTGERLYIDNRLRGTCRGFLLQRI